LDRINEHLELQRRTWNDHELSREAGRYTPNQLREMYKHLAPQPTGLLEDPVPDGLLGEEYGNEELTTTVLEVEPIVCPMTEDQYVEFQTLVLRSSLSDVRNESELSDHFGQSLTICLRLMED
jgi:hypothetical protein